MHAWVCTLRKGSLLRNPNFMEDSLRPVTRIPGTLWWISPIQTNQGTLKGYVTARFDNFLLYLLKHKTKVPDQGVCCVTTGCGENRHSICALLLY